MTDEHIGSDVYQVLLYYRFTPIDDPAAFAEEHRALCERLGLRGRILVSGNGINGTVSGPTEACRTYMDTLHADPRFTGMPFKIDEVDGHVFQKLFVRVKPELVTFRTEYELDPAKKTGTHLSPAEYHEMLQRDDVIILDGRTDY